MDLLWKQYMIHPPMVILKYNQIISEFPILEISPLAFKVWNKLVYLWVYVVPILMIRNARDKNLPRAVILVDLCSFSGVDVGFAEAAKLCERGSLLLFVFPSNFFNFFTLIP